MMVKALIDGRRRDSARGLTLLGVELRDAKEEIFVRMVCDGLAIGVAFRRAGFSSKTKDAPYNLWQLPRVQERASKILEARRTTGVVTLGEVTDMLQRVFAGAHAAEEFSAAHNAAFSLARIYGHVTDKSVVEHIRRPSRDPDAPSETALEAWAASLPVVGATPATQLKSLSESPLQGPPAPLLGLEPQPCTTPSVQPEIEWLDRSTQGPGLDGPDGIGNGAPVGPVTGTPSPRGRTEISGSPSADEGTGTDMGENSQNQEILPVWPDIEDLF